MLEMCGHFLEPPIYLLRVELCTTNLTPKITFVLKKKQFIKKQKLSSNRFKLKLKLMNPNLNYNSN